MEKFGADAYDTIRLKSPVRKPTDQRQAALCLIVLDGPDRGSSIALNQGTHVLGRAGSIAFQDRGVSRYHASLTVADGRVTIADLGSTNGTLVDGEIVSEPRELAVGQTIDLGPQVKLRLEAAQGGLPSLLQEMRQAATHDALTGLLTRRTFEERLEIEFAMVRRHKMASCLAVLDLDHFKNINDTLGHDAGDQALRTIGGLLAASVRIGDLVGRWGGEEFVIYIRQTPLTGGITMLERLRHRVAQTPVELPERPPLSLTFSAGLVELLPFPDWATAFRRADEALYRAKREGRNRLVAAGLDVDGTTAEG